MKYLMARDAGVDAAKYVIKRWPKLFSSKDFNPVCVIFSLVLLTPDVIFGRISDLNMV